MQIETFGNLFRINVLFIDFIMHNVFSKISSFEYFEFQNVSLKYDMIKWILNIRFE